MRKFIIFLFVISFVYILNGCSSNNCNREKIQISDVIYYNGEGYELGDFFRNKQLYYSYADIDNDGEKELGLRTNEDSFVVDLDTRHIIYEGSSYEYLVECNEYKGLVYMRDGGAPNHTDYQFSTIDELGKSNVEFSVSWYDLDENNEYDGNDMFYINDKEVEYQTWKERTITYLEIADMLCVWNEFIWE